MSRFLRLEALVDRMNHLKRARPSRWLRAFAGLALFAGGCGAATGNVLESPAADGGTREAGGSSGAPGESSSSSSGDAPSDDAGESDAATVTGGFAATETWNVVAGDRSGTIVITNATVDVQLGEYTLAVALAGADGITMDQTNAGTPLQHYTGTRSAGAPLDLGVTPLSLAGSWTLTSERRTLSGTLDEDAVHVQCDGECQFYELETVDVTRTTTETGPTFGKAHGVWSAAAHETEPGGASEIRIQTNRIEIDVGAVSFSATWSGNTMSGLYEGTSEFAAERL